MADVKYIGKNILNHDLILNRGNVSGSAASTGSFGHIIGTLAGLTIEGAGDTSISAPSNGHILSYSTASSAWENSGASSDLVGLGQRYKHTQGSANVTWTVSHSMGFQYPTISVYDDNDKLVIPTEVTATSADVLTITFDSPVAGTAILSTGGSATSGGQNYNHTQGSANVTWTVSHNLEYQYPAVTVYDSNSDVMIPQRIRATNANTLTLTFTQAESGYAHVSVGGGLPYVTATNAGKYLRVRDDASGVQWTTSQFSGSSQFTGSVGVTGSLDVTGTATFGSLSDGTITIAAFADEDDMSSNSATLLPTQQSVKTYVDAVTTELQAQDLDFIGDSGGALNIDLDTETLTIAGGTNATTVGSGNGVTINVDDAFLKNNASDTTSGTITAAGLITSGNISGSAASTGSFGALAIGEVISNWTNAGNTVADLGTITTADINGGTIDGTTIGSTTHTSIKGTFVQATEELYIGGTVITDNTITDDGTLVISSMVATSFENGNIVDIGSLEADVIKIADATSGLQIQFGGNTTLNKITLTDNLAEALTIEQGGNDYMKFVTTNSSEQIVFGKNSTFNGTTIANLGTVTGATSITSTAFVGDITGDVTGNADTVTSIGNLTGVVTSTNRATAIADNAISGDKIDGGTISSFRSTGIDDNADALAITIDSSEKIGIGTTVPSQKLTVAGNISGSGTLDT